MYFKRASFQDRSQIINKIKVPKISDILQKIKWDNIFDSYPILYFMVIFSQRILFITLIKNLFYLIGEKILELLKYTEIYIMILQNSIMH